MILLLIIRAQQPLTLRPGGLFNYDHPLITKVLRCLVVALKGTVILIKFFQAVRMQASLCALLQTI